MKTDKDEKNKNAQQQTVQTNEGHINPFRDADKPDNPPTPAEEAAREQQLKEAMTERD